MAGLLPGCGDVLIDGRAVHTLPGKEKARRIGYAPQHPPEGLTVTDYALLGRTPHLGLLARESAADLSIVDSLLARLDLYELAGRKLGTLSGGERQRAVLARVLAQRAGCCYSTSPPPGWTSGTQVMLELIDRLHKEDGTAVVSTLHDLTFAAQYAERMLLLSAGEVVAAGTPVEVLTAQTLARHYGALADILTAARGEIVVAPLRQK
jgi:iron complex transport system ATP-binding protein